MSRVNKVNPGKYTQRGRLTPDEAAREMAKQREMSSPKRTEGGQFGEKTKARVQEKDSPSRDEEEDGKD